ncbi:hypothetical protein KIW84_075543 [Lathyrus oleraceus]|uniref:Uncharacterized protein n=1 Tax=Pisum sativum TaxID=3888 RepID=A0A9D5A015_PEA|nr:hypothetical protein KIW84_075543 [Pisum sativum]
MFRSNFIEGLTDLDGTYEDEINKEDFNEEQNSVARLLNMLHNNDPEENDSCTTFEIPFVDVDMPTHFGVDIDMPTYFRTSTDSTFCHGSDAPSDFSGYYPFLNCYQGIDVRPVVTHSSAYLPNDGESVQQLSCTPYISCEGQPFNDEAEGDEMGTPFQNTFHIDHAELNVGLGVKQLPAQLTIMLKPDTLLFGEMTGLSVIMVVAGERPRSRQHLIGDSTILLQWAIDEVLELDYALFKSHTCCKQQENCQKYIPNHEILKEEGSKTFCGQALRGATMLNAKALKEMWSIIAVTPLEKRVRFGICSGA